MSTQGRKPERGGTHHEAWFYMLRGRFRIFVKPYLELIASQVQRKIVLWLVLALFGWITVGCNQQPTKDPLADESFLTEQPCAPPCWYGLELDISTEEEVYSVIESLPFVDPATIRESQQHWLSYENVETAIDFGCLHPQEHFCGEMRVAQDKLKLISLLVNYDLSFETVVDKLGPPEYVDYGIYGPEDSYCLIKLNWPEQSIVTRSLPLPMEDCIAIEQGKNRIFPNIKAGVIIYMVRERFLDRPASLDLRIQWPGFAEP